MMSSLPPLAPPDAHNLWYPAVSSHSHQAPAASPPNDSRLTRGSQHSRSHPAQPVRTILSTLRADENAIQTRKANIRRFGAGWLKPPGVAKTLQGMIDEKAEREEQDAAALREQATLEAQAAAEAEAEAAEAAMGVAPQGLMGEEESGGEEERDLDDDIPDADDHDAWIDEDGDDALPHGEGDGDYAEGEAMDGDGEAEARDLDDDVPEAGSYQHTDTDVEDVSSDYGEGPARELLPAGMVPHPPSGVLDSSVFGGSPAVHARRSFGQSGRGRGREN